MVGAIRFPSTRRSRRGAIALEYALVLAFVAVGVLASLLLLGDKLTGAIGVFGDGVSTVADTLDFK